MGQREIIFGVEPLDEEHKQTLLGLEALANVFGGRDNLAQHMAENSGVRHPVPEIQKLAERLKLVNLPGCGDYR